MLVEHGYYHSILCQGIALLRLQKVISIKQISCFRSQSYEQSQTILGTAI